MNWIDFIILGAIAAVLVLVVVRFVRRRRAGNSPCAGCSYCDHPAACPSNVKDDTKV